MEVVLSQVSPVKIGVVLSTDDPETCWNALRYCVKALQGGHRVRLFLLGKGVELEGLHDPSFDTAGELAKVAKLGGVVQACGTCLESRHKGGTAACPASSMADLLRLTEESDRVLTFG